MRAFPVKSAIGFICFAAASFVFFQNSASGQPWVQKMFKESAHDFGNVQLGDTPVHRFKFENLYNETLRIRGVTSSCGCTIATASKTVLKTFEKAEIVCKFNSPAVGAGFKQATITIQFDQPYRGEMQLTVKGNIVTGVALSPTSIDFGQVVETNLPVRKIKLNSSGNPAFRINDVKSVFKHIKVDVKETARRNGMVSYDIITQLKDTVPKGFIQDQLYLVVEEGRNLNGQARLRQLTLPFTAKVTSALQVSPEVVSMGPLKPGEVVKKKVFLKSEKPFRIRDVRCKSDAFSVKADAKVKKVHIVEVSYTGEDEPGRHECSLSFYVDYPDSAATGSSDASGSMKAIIEIADGGEAKTTAN
jgi:hypothetical protein